MRFLILQKNQLDKKLAALKAQIRFVATVRKQVFVGFILAVYLSFIVIFLQPFDTSEFEADYKQLLLSGYGILTFAVFIAHSRLETIFYLKTNKIWTVTCEIISNILFCLFAGTILYLYNRFVVNMAPCTLAGYWRFVSVTVAYMTPVFVPPMLYLRQRFGERIVPIVSSAVVIMGENRDEVLKMEKDELLFIRAVENYVEICFLAKDNKVMSRTFRQTLSNIGSQLPFLQKCHRSYLVNVKMVKGIAGNSQGATISFLTGVREIPVSKTYYKQIKSLCIDVSENIGPDRGDSSKKLVTSSNSAD